jgi:hypothetical protein
MREIRVMMLQVAFCQVLQVLTILNPENLMFLKVVVNYKNLPTSLISKVIAV